MTAGCQIFDAAGVLTFTSTDVLPRVLGNQQTGTVPGSVTDAGLANGTPYFFYVSYHTGTWLSQPTVTRSGNTISWAWTNDGGVQANRSDGFIVYGIK